MGNRLSYAVQPEPGGLAQAFIIGEDFIAGDPSCLILGDNIFLRSRHGPAAAGGSERERGATVFGYWVRDPERYGVAEFDAAGNVVSWRRNRSNQNPTTQ